jgi:hypothetical protein
MMRVTTLGTVHAIKIHSAKKIKKPPPPPTHTQLPCTCYRATDYHNARGTAGQRKGAGIACRLPASAGAGANRLDTDYLNFNE